MQETFEIHQQVCQAQRHPKHCKVQEGTLKRMTKRQAIIFEASFGNAALKVSRHMMSTKWPHLRELMLLMMKYTQQMENTWELPEKVVRCQARMICSQEQHRMRNNMGLHGNGNSATKNTTRRIQKSVKRWQTIGVSGETIDVYIGLSTDRQNSQPKKRRASSESGEWLLKKQWKPMKDTEVEQGWTRVLRKKRKGLCTSAGVLVFFSQFLAGLIL